MSRYPRNFGRRQFLIGAQGLLFIPMLESLVPRSARAAVTRAAANDAAMRLVCVHSCHGWATDQWVPSKTGADFPLSPILTPLKNVKDRTVVFSKMQNDAALRSESPGGEDTHAKGIATLFTGANLKTGSTVNAGPSMDQIFAQSIGGKTPVASLQLGLASQEDDNHNNYPGALMKCISYADAQTPLTDQTDPQQVFDKYFASSGAGAQAQAALRQQRRSTLDGVLDQANALKSKLGRGDADKLDQYFTGVRALELQFAAITNASCGNATKPGTSKLTDYEARANAFMDLVVLAFSCDLTRSITFNFGAGHNNHKYSFLPNVDDAHHNLTHNLSRSGVRDMVNRINAWEVSVAARMLEKLKAVPEGSATLLDNSATLISTEQSIAGQHGYRDLPVVLVGGAGGKIDGNRHVQVGGASTYGNLTEVELAILQSVGVKVTSFGGFNTTRAISLKA